MLPSPEAKDLVPNQALRCERSLGRFDGNWAEERQNVLWEKSLTCFRAIEWVEWEVAKTLSIKDNQVDTLKFTNLEALGS